MTQPVQEPTQGRINQGQAFAARQLFRRPAQPSSGGGAGLQFNSGTYGPDNLGDWLMVEANDYLGQDFTETPNGMQFDPRFNYSAGFNAKYGTVFTCDPTAYDQNVAVGIHAVNGTNGSDAAALSIFAANEFGSGGRSQAIIISSYSEDNRSAGVDAGSGTSTGTAWGADFDATATGSAGIAYGLRGRGYSTSGNSRGLWADARGTGSAEVISLYLQNGSAFGNPLSTAGLLIKGETVAGAGTPVVIFTVDLDGNIHIPAAASVINDL